MSGLPPELQVDEWIRLAEQDLRMAELGLQDSADPALESICFRAQQCAEKYLKALALSLGLSIPRSHDLRILLDLLPARIANQFDRPTTFSLNRYTVEGRYPGPWEPLDVDETEEALRAAREVRMVVLRSLGTGP